jgi:hypothetical protein
MDIPLKVQKNENFFGSDFEFCSTSLLVMLNFFQKTLIFKQWNSRKFEIGAKQILILMICLQ